MFDFLKKKIKTFVGQVVGQSQASEEKIEEGSAANVVREVASRDVFQEPLNPPPSISQEKPTSETPLPEPVPEVEEIQHAVHVEELKEAVEKEERREITQQAVETLEMTGSTSQPLSEQLEKDEEEIEELVGGTVEGSIKKEQQRIEKKIVEHKRREDVSKHVFQDKKKESFLVDEKERELKPRVGLLTQLKGVITGGITISEKETEPLFEDLEMALLESDVSMDTAQALVADLRKRLVGKRVARGNVEEEVKKEIAFALSSVMHAHKTDFVERISEAKKQNRTPYVVLFLGPNGAGKTTTIAKIAYQLRQSGFTSVISASDTFRAAAIEQAEYHGKKLGVKVIRHRYGADPAAVAFDAIAHAKSTGIDVVLIDTAGRQETNRNLLAEMEKIVRISQPDLKVFVAEAIAGTSMVQQLKKFHEKLGVDGIILTKLDCDAKGGGSLSISFECQLPILFVGVGQSYDDLKPFNEEWIVRNIMAE